jgi:hypothetical protein
MNIPGGSSRYHRAQWCPTAIIRGRDIVHPSGLPLQTCPPRSLGPSGDRFHTDGYGNSHGHIHIQFVTIGGLLK